MTRLLPLTAAAVLLVAASCATDEGRYSSYPQPVYLPPDTCDPTLEPCPPPYCPGGGPCQPYGAASPYGAYGAPAPYYGPPPAYEHPERYGRGGGHDDEARGERHGDERHEAVPAPPRGDRRGGEERGGDRGGERGERGDRD